MRWNRKFYGSKESLRDKSHRPHSKHPNAHTDKELKWIQDYHRRNPKISVCELYGKLLSSKGYSRNPGHYTAFTVSLVIPVLPHLQRPDASLSLMTHPPSLVSNGKWMSNMFQLPAMPDPFLKSSTSIQLLTKLPGNSLYTLIWSRAATLLWTFLERAILYFGYQPAILQTDNGTEFTHIQKTERVHPLDILCNQLKISHKRIRPRTPRHNGKVERSHRND